MGVEDPWVRRQVKKNLAKGLGTQDSVLLKGKWSKSYSMAGDSGGGPSCLNGEKMSCSDKETLTSI